MEDFGVLTERFGLKRQGKSAPMAASKQRSINNTQTRNLGSNSFPNPKSSLYSNSTNGTFVENQDFIFPSSSNKETHDFDNIFGDFEMGRKQSSSTNGFDYDSIFASLGSKRSSMNLDDNYDIFDLKKSLNTNFADNDDDVIGSFNSSVDDLLFDGLGVKSKHSSLNGSLKVGSDDLIPGFAASSNGEQVTMAKSMEDPFVVLESTSNAVNASFTDPLEEISKLSRGKRPGNSSTVTQPLRPPPPPPAQVVKVDKAKSSNVSPIDELEDFAMGRGRKNNDLKERPSTKASRYKEAEDASVKSQQKGEDDLEFHLGMGSRSSSVPRSRDITSASVFDANTHDRKGPEWAKKAPSGVSSSMKKDPPVMNMFDGLSSYFGADPLFVEFDEFEGESDDRRKKRLGRHQRTQNRVAQAVADMNQRDRQTQYEQEERRRLADTLDFEIKRWAAGKEGNMRALLSSLQQVLWPECDWEPVSLTDLITSTSVKKVYRKATLYVHPDKVQQKGATLQQKYIAEKVFDILKEAWNKFNSEELS
ncbi:DnaJ domain-containing protein [Cephalotus follicularis]|uniref:DnaJ domain-containing protein n=1 Tax=Cephalotus follicularis TaxID=3775 RepID=A0A1Q3BVS0_CEPFO|nr:DnaJ domain-containing protein [Cephalotus follicularis]